MGGPPSSQVAPLPTNLPFRLVSKTIGSGAYASIRKAIPLQQSGPVIAVKFVNKDHAYRAGRLKPKQLDIEASLHMRVSKHPNIISFINYGQDPAWVWMCMELAEGGDLFDKIEADEGVGEDVAHFYFTQLVAAINWCHEHGVAHRDIKPENMLLSAAGDLRLADFGLATQFLLPGKGERKSCSMVCGSPPYIAPEILAVGTHNSKYKGSGNKATYDPQIADVWSCAIVLFVLLVGNTPWDSPVAEESYEYYDYIQTGGRPSDELWQNIPSAALSLLRGMLNITHTERFTLDNARKHPWFTRPNPHLNSKGLAANPVGLATQMLESLHIDFSAPITSSQSQSQSQRPRPPPASSDPNAMDLDPIHPHPSTQPETPIAELTFDWEAPPRVLGGPSTGSSQPLPGSSSTHTFPASSSSFLPPGSQNHILDLLSTDPGMSQFSSTPGVPLTLTQAARKFADIVPAHSLARFISPLPAARLLPMLGAALHRLDIAVPDPTPRQLGTATSGEDGEGDEEGGRGASAAAAAAAPTVVSVLRVRTLDARAQPLHGSVIVERIPVPGQVGLEVLEVRFQKAKGDPVGWRRFFKQVAVLCKDGVVIPN